MVLEQADRVVIVPGYGLAVAQAQHAVRELADVLEERGTSIAYAIHPVAGRMPGHMNVLLAEADIPYEQLVDPYGIAFWPQFKGRDGCRTPMPWHRDKVQAGFTESTQTPWLPIPVEHKASAVNVQSEDPNSVFHETRALIEFHRTEAAFHSSQIHVVDSPEDLLVFERGTGENAMLCIFNLSDQPIPFELPAKWHRASTRKASHGIDAEPDQPTSLYEPWSWRFLSSHSTDR